MKKATQSESTASFRRRKFMHEEIRRKGFVSLDELKRKGARPASEGGDFTCPNQSLADDLEFLSSFFDWRVESVSGENGERNFVATAIAMESARNLRSQLAVVQKKAIGRLAGVLACSAIDLGTAIDGPYDDSEEFISPLACARSLTPKQVLDEVADTPITGRHLRRRLSESWRKISRRVTLDAGTTCEAVGTEVIAKIELPSRRSILHHMEVLTNSRHIFYDLGAPQCMARAICIGGTQAKGSEALCGHLAQSFLEQSGLRSAIAFIGATSINLKDMQVCSDRTDDAEMKAMLLERSEIRVVLADSRKFGKHSYTACYPFAGISPSLIDIIVTDPFRDKVFQREVRDMLRAEGIVLLIADESKMRDLESEI